LLIRVQSNEYPAGKEKMKASILFSKVLVVLLVSAMMFAFSVELSTPRAQEAVLGDVSGDGNISSVDASMALQIANGILSPTADQRSAADADQDGSVTSADAEIILQCAAEKCSAFNRKNIGPGGGTLEADDLTITIPPGTFSEEATIAVKTKDPYPIQYENLSPLGSFYQLEHFPQLQGPITIEISFDPDAIAPEDSVYIYQEQLSFITGVGVAQSGHPRLDTEVDKTNGTATIQIVPHETNTATVSTKNLREPLWPQDSDHSYDDVIIRGGRSIVIGGTAGKNFPEVKDEFFHIIDYTRSEGSLDDILGFFIEAKKELESLGFKFEEWIKPLEVFIKNNLDSGGEAFSEETHPPSRPWLWHPRIHVLPGLSKDKLKIAAGHELFHIFQLFYGAYGNDYLGFVTPYEYTWIREASSVWFEKKVSGKGEEFYSERAEANSDFIFSPLETEKRHHGYGASSFLTYLTEQSEYGDKFIYNIYDKIENEKDNSTSTGALEAALGGSDTLSAKFSDFAFKFISKTTGYANWPQPLRPDDEIDMGADQQQSKQLNLSALSA
jgi:hypothetical protein